MNRRAFVFSGTSDGSQLSLCLAKRGWQVTVCTATEYGRSCTANHENIHVLSGRLDRLQMQQVLSEGQFTAVVDATHPYAAEVSENIQAACAQQRLPYYRLLRAQQQFAHVVEVDHAAQAAEFLATTQGNVLLTTGSKDLAAYTSVPDYRKRLFARVLSTQESIEKCHALGFEGRNLIAMQGPFSEEMNIAMLRQVQARWLVSKESGTVGGVEEKISAAQKTGVGVVLIRRPRREQGDSLSGILKALTGCPAEKTVYLVGIGMGSQGGMTQDAIQALQQAELVIGAARMLDAVNCHGKRVVEEYRTAQIVAEIQKAEETRIAVALSGDIGFYSGAKALWDALRPQKDITICPICGISSVAYLCAKLGVCWQDAVLVSMHGRENNLPGIVRENALVFAITGKNTTQLLQQLCDFGLGDVQVSIGSDLSYPTEKILTGTAQQLREIEIAPLCAMLVQNHHAASCQAVPGIADAQFLRGKVPMTKEEVRAVSLCKLRLTKQAVVYDVGAGTGSVSIEAARIASNGRVYAIEKKAEACQLILENCRHFAVGNVELVQADAPAALETLPAPTHVFIGGSGGNMAQIVACVLQKNPCARVVINTIAMESTQEALEIVRNFPVQDIDIAVLNVAKSKEVGPYHMMTGNNPVTVISFTGNGEKV